MKQNKSAENHRDKKYDTKDFYIEIGNDNRFIKSLCDAIISKQFEEAKKNFNIILGLNEKLIQDLNLLMQAQAKDKGLCRICN